MDKHIGDYLDNLIKQHLNSLQFSSLTEQQRSEAAENLRLKLYKATVEELLDRLNDDQINQIADLDVASPQFEAKVEAFAAAIPDFLFMLEGRFQQELASFQPVA